MWKNDRRHGEGMMSFKDKCNAKIRFNNGKVEAVISYEYDKNCKWANTEFWNFYFNLFKFDNIKIIKITNQIIIFSFK